MKVEKAHLFFEQSGTFKKAFQNLGIKAYDYDIQNEFGETDFVVDLFEEINRAFDGKPSVFDKVGKHELIFAFFPCVRFENQINLFFRGQAYQQTAWTDEERMLYDMNLIDEVRDLYHLINKLFIVCIRGGGIDSLWKIRSRRNTFSAAIGACNRALLTETGEITGTIPRSLLSIGSLIAHQNRTFCLKRYPITPSYPRQTNSWTGGHL